jgi:tetratricopeptide (TPR) repeat protein
LVDGIEQDLHQSGKVEILSSVIGEMVMRHLMELDRIAYIRFASVYREFTDIETFKQEVDALALGKLGDYSGAYKAFKKAGNEATAKNNMGYIYLLDGKTADAVQAFEKAIELNPAFYAKAHDNLDAARSAMKEKEGQP